MSDRSTQVQPAWSAAGTLARLAAFVVAYFALAQLGLLFAAPGSLASPVWPPAGLAIAFAVLWGRRVLPAVFVGAFAVQYASAGSLPLSLLLAAGNTTEAFVGGWLVARAGGAAVFGSMNGVLHFTRATVLAPLVAATAGATGLVLFGGFPASAGSGLWWTWYLGDVAGAFVVAPVVLLLMTVPARQWTGGRPAEALAMTTFLLAMTALVLGVLPGIEVQAAPFIIVVMPAIAWAAYRLGPTMAALSVFLADGLSILGRRLGNGPFQAADETVSLLVLQAFLFALGFMALGVAALTGERRRSAAELEHRIADRTARLEEVNGLLRGEIEERRRAQEEVAEAQAIAQVGSWWWDVTKPTAVWSAELYRIYALDPATHVPTYADYLTRVHPEDVERVKAVTEEVFRDHKPYSHDERIRRPDGTWRNLHTWARAILDDDGKLKALFGVCQDVTDRVAQEGKFRGLLESAPDAMIIAGADGRIVLVNEQAERMFGYTRSELLGQAIDLLVPDAVRGRHAAHRADYAKEPRSRPMGAGLDLKARRKDGSEFPVEISLSPLETPEGRLVSSAIRDVSDRKKAQLALEESLERFRALAEAAPIGIVHTRADGVVDYVNDKWRQITGVVDHTDGESLRRSVHPEDQPVMAKMWQACVREGREFAAEFRFVHRDGAVRWTSARAEPVRDSTGAITGFVSTVEDTTDRRAAEAKDREVRRLREQTEFKTNFLRTAAHELGTPLTPIKIQMRILRDLLAGSGREDERKASEILERNINRLQVLVQDMLESARLQSGRLRLTVRPMDMAQTVHEVVETFQGPAIQTGVVLDTQGPNDMPMVGDPDRLSQVLYNLLSNAMKFTPVGGQIHVRLAADGADGVRVTVQDSGSGFTREQADQLFQPFTQLQDAMQKTKGGSGLGLYISRGIVEQHGGSLTCESPGPGMGATFTFVVPRVSAPVAAPSLAPAAEAPVARSAFR